MTRRGTAEERFWPKVEKTETCWLWTAHIDGSGYGNFWAEGRQAKAHRWAYETLVGPIPEGLQLDHLCRVRHCVNPEHLEAVTQQENISRGQTGAWNAEKTHCPHGHEYTPENTYVGRYAPRRDCRICMRDRARQYYWSRKSASA